METKKNNTRKSDNNPGLQQSDAAENAALKEHTVAAYKQAEADIEEDADLSIEENLGDDLDEGELARLGNSDDTTDLV